VGRVFESNGHARIGCTVYSLPQKLAGAPNPVTQQVLPEGHAKLCLERPAEGADRHATRAGNSRLPEFVGVVLLDLPQGWIQRRREYRSFSNLVRYQRPDATGSSRRTLLVGDHPREHVEIGSQLTRADRLDEEVPHADPKRPNGQGLRVLRRQHQHGHGGMQALEVAHGA